MLALGGWGLLTGLGGWALARAAFRLAPEEELPAGLVLGTLLEVVLANFLAQVIGLPAAAWVSAAALAAAGLLLLVLRRDTLKPRPRIAWQAWAIALAAVLVFYPVSRGIALFDDYAHLPTLSVMATGQIPPHFALNPEARYGYHTFLLLLAAQWVRIGGLSLWAAWDAARVASLGLALAAGVVWARRVTGSSRAGAWMALFLLFAGGTRWMLALLPPGLLARLSAHVTLLGSSAQSAPNLAAGLQTVWNIDGGGPLAFPFAFANGLIPPGSLLVHYSTAWMPVAFLVFFLLSAPRWRSARLAAPLSALAFSALGLLAEMELLYLAGGLALVSLLAWLRLRRIPPRLAAWWGVLAAGGALIAVQGGAWTDTLLDLLQRLQGGAPAVGYQTVSLAAAWPPALVSSHLGVLSLLDPAALAVALAEAGPLLLVFPLVVVFGWKAARAGRWFEGALAAAGLLSLAALLLRYGGSTGVRNTSRLYFFLPLSLLFAVPLGARWLRSKPGWLRAGATALAGMSLLGGLMMAALQLPAAQKPVASYYLSELDARIYARQWNRLAPGAWVYSRDPNRGVAVFGRYTRSSSTWFVALPEFETLAARPAAADLVAAGYRYAYFSKSDWDDLTPALRAPYESGCAVPVDQAGAGTDFRRLYDLEACR